MGADEMTTCDKKECRIFTGDPGEKDVSREDIRSAKARFLYTGGYNTGSIYKPAYQEIISKRQKNHKRGFTGLALQRQNQLLQFHEIGNPKASNRIPAGSSVPVSVGDNTTTRNWLSGLWVDTITTD